MKDLGIISPAMMKLFQSCPLKFYFRYIENISAPVLDKNFLLGKRIHTIASYYLNKENITDFLTSLSNVEVGYFNFLKDSEYFKYDVVGTEKSISVKINDFWIGGRIDAVVRNDRDYYILDYKTGGVLEDMTYDFQTMVYLLLCEKFYPEYNNLSFVYIDLKNSRCKVISFNDNLKIEYEGRLTEICAAMTAFNRLKFKKQCDDNCEYSKLCINY